jgi:hypothetical protein
MLMLLQITAPLAGLTTTTRTARTAGGGPAPRP